MLLIPPRSRIWADASAPTLARLVPKWLLVIAAAVAAVPLQAAPAANCLVVCPSKNCLVPSDSTILPGVRTRVESCGQKHATVTPVYGLYQTARGPERFTIMLANKPFDEQVPQLATATCLVGAACLEDRDASRLAPKGGMGADEDKAVRQGRPCEAGLPCGQVLMPRERLVIDVPSTPTGTFTLKAKRGGGGAVATFAVRDGRIEIPAASLAPGAVYTYALVGAPGASPVSGEFALLGSKMQKDVEQAIDAARRSDPDGGALAEIEILVEEKLQWDATQRLR